MTTNIEWARNPDGSKGETWPVCTGCTPVSEGCRNCYAARMAATRLKHHPRYEGLATFENGRARWTGEVRLNHDVLEQPLQWRKPRMIFIASMGDLFHKDVPDDFIFDILEIIAQCPQHIFQILTKRSKRMVYLWRNASGNAYPNLWLGVSVENQAAADERILSLLQTPAAVHYVSVEPMLEAVDLKSYLPCHHCDGTGIIKHGYMRGFQCACEGRNSIDWVICGSESGPGARPMDEDWVRDLRDQRQAAGVAFFYKQRIVNGRKVGMPILDGRIWDEMPKGE